LVGVSEHQVAGVQQHRPPSGRVSDPVAADFDGLGRDLTEILNDDTSALGGGARIHPDAHVHRQLPVGARHCDLRDVSNTRALSGNPQPTTTAGVDAEHRPVVEPGGGVVALAAAEDRAQFLGGYPGGRDLAALVAAPETARAVRSLLC
jgi:hypothetical protein